MDQVQQEMADSGGGGSICKGPILLGERGGFRGIPLQAPASQRGRGSGEHFVRAGKVEKEQIQWCKQVGGSGAGGFSLVAPLELVRKN